MYVCTNCLSLRLSCTYFALESCGLRFTFLKRSISISTLSCSFKKYMTNLNSEGSNRLLNSSVPNFHRIICSRKILDDALMYISHIYGELRCTTPVSSKPSNKIIFPIINNIFAPKMLHNSSNIVMTSV